MCVLSEPKCPQFWKKCLHAPHAAFSSSVSVMCLSAQLSVLALCLFGCNRTVNSSDDDEFFWGGIIYEHLLRKLWRNIPLPKKKSSLSPHAFTVLLHPNKHRANTDNWALKHIPETNKVYLSWT